MKKSRLLLLFTLLLCFSLKSYTQPWLENIKTENPSFKELQDAFYNYWKDKPIEKGKGYKQFKRWEDYFSTRLLNDGKLPQSDITSKNWKAYQDIHTEQLSRTTSTANWTFTGPTTSPGGYNGLGRINCIAFHPTNPNIFWVGTPSGGLWKTINGGTSWTTVTDNLPVLGVSDIAIDPTNANIMYIATGDGDGGSLGSLTGGSDGDTKSIGVLKSTDGGSTWSATGLNWSVTSSKLIRRLIINPSNPNILIAAASDGLYKTVNAGISWTNVQSGYFMDAEFKPNDANTVYAATYTWTTGGSAQIFRSIDGGTIWSSIAALSGVYRINLAVSPSNSNYVDAVAVNAQRGLEGLWFSSNSGASFSRYFTGTNSNNLLHSSYNASGSGGQGEYDLAYTINPNNINDIWLGGVNTWNSTDGGFTWNLKTMWNGNSIQNPNGVPTVHADKHFIVFHPLVSGTMFECNDGGLYKTTNGGATWTDLSNGLGISQIYRIGTSATISNNVIIGLQDNGTKELYSNSFFERTGGDGMECIIDYTNANIMYSSVQNGEIIKTTNGFSTSSTIVNNNGSGVNELSAWVTPFVMHPTNNNRLIVGKSQVYETTDGGTTWNQLGNITGATGKLIALVYAPSNPQVIYASTRTQIFKTSNGGTNWTMLNGTAITTAASPNTYLVVNPTNPDLLYTTQGGYVNADKIWSANTTNPASPVWQNLSGTLPNVPVNCVVYQNGSNGALYIGTDVGVFYKNNLLTDWVTYQTGLPNVVVTELEISYNNNKLWAATFGRGLWNSDLYTIVPLTLINFEAKAVSKEVQLAWKTTNEVNTKEFELQKCYDGNSFEKIGVVTSTNLSVENNYQFIDKKPALGNNFYRLKMIDKDGKFTYSPIRNIILKESKNLFTIFPNPANDIINIDFKSVFSNAEIMIFDAQGKSVFQKKISNLGINQYSINSSGFSNGVYLIQISIGSETYVERVIISK